MKVKVLERFIDKETMLLNEVGSIIEVSKERLTEIQSKGVLLEVIEDTPKKTRAKTSNKKGG